ncbi:MAG: helix-turn-helix domain-containing protein [Ardenticatenaceae bacterium]
MANWLSLTDAAKLLGIHSSTLRRWSDNGRIASVRTTGGHRRFERAVLERYLAQQQSPQAPAAPPPPQVSPAPAPPQAAYHSSEALAPSERSPVWQQTFQGQSLEEVRHLGQRLLGLMLQYLTRQNEDERFLAEGRHIGRIYGKETAEADLAMLDMVEAFLFFRSRFTTMAIQLPAFPREGDDAEMRRLHSRLDRFMNEVLLGAIEGYEEHTGISNP